MVIAVRSIEAFKGFAAIVRAEKAGVGDVDFVGILGIGPKVGEIPGALAKTVIVVDQRSVRAAIVAAVKTALLGFDERVNDI